MFGIVQRFYWINPGLLTQRHFSTKYANLCARLAVAGSDAAGAGGSRDNIITVPIRLGQRLEEKVIRDNKKYMVRKRIIQASRKGSSTVVISAKKNELNHYVGQSYSAKEELPLVSRGWAHRKAASAGDFFKIHAHGTNTALPDVDDKTTFDDLGLKSNLIELLAENGIRQPTQIQAAAIPKLLNGANCLISAETGCGKTLAYLLPLFQQILEAKRRRNFRETMNDPLVLILVPTRELGYQVANVAQTFASSLGINVKLLQGGGIGAKIKNPPSLPIDLMVSTVSVVAELTKVEVYSMRRLKTIILDEADTLTDDSFSEDILEFLAPFSFTDGEHKIQLALVSATMPCFLDSILHEKLSMDSLVKVTTPGLHMVMKHVPQTFLRIKKSDKSTKIVELLKKDSQSGTSTIVFCNNQDTCTWLQDHLGQNDIRCIGLNGRMSPAMRRQHLKSYLDGEFKVLVCTDIGSRGIDTIQTGHVINYDFPSYIADYVHRCGRTGRVGSKVPGKVTSLIAWPTEAQLVQQIERSVKRETSLQRVDANIKKLLNTKYGYGMGQPILPNEDKTIE